jgi:hypothetical protein
MEVMTAMEAGAEHDGIGRHYRQMFCFIILFDGGLRLRLERGVI